MSSDDAGQTPSDVRGLLMGVVVLVVSVLAAFAMAVAGVMPAPGP
jgi:hypothetical protein